MRRDLIKAPVQAIEQALAMPGFRGVPRGKLDAVVVVNLRSFLAEGGVLDQLRAKRYVVKAPFG